MQGDKIWSVQGERALYLDGQTFGRLGFRRDGTTPRTDLVFPSGDGARASDFESWMYVPAQIIVPPPELKDFTISPHDLQAGARVTCTVVLTNAAPAGGLDISLAKSVLAGGDPVPLIPTSVKVPEGQAVHTFNLQTILDVAGQVAIKATLRQMEKSATFATQVVSVTISPATATLIVGASQQFTANVQGTFFNRAEFSIRETGGGSVAPSTGTSTTYTAPGQPGRFHLVAKSSADPRKAAVAIIEVKGKEKEKEKERPDKLKEDKIPREKLVKDSEKNREKILAEKTRERIQPFEPLGGSEPRRDMDQTADTGHMPPEEAIGQAFIRSEERPPVGEPQGTADKPPAKQRKRKDKK
jgi:hypothetical protein